MFVSEPFELPASRQAVEIHASADCEQSWIGLDTALINDDSGESDAVGIDLSYYHGYEGGESWSEGSRSGTAEVGGVKRGRYVLRVEPQFGKDAAGRLPPTVHVVVRRGPFLWTPALLAFGLILAWPLVLFLRSRGFEKRRWEDSDHPMTSASS